MFSASVEVDGEYVCNVHICVMYGLFFCVSLCVTCMWYASLSYGLLCGVYVWSCWLNVSCMV